MNKCVKSFKWNVIQEVFIGTSGKEKIYFLFRKYEQNRVFLFWQLCFIYGLEVWNVVVISLPEEEVRVG
jgi:hypothetical protein